MPLNRRDFLKLFGSSALMATLPVFSETRKPFVSEVSSPVNYIGVKGKGFIGSKIVRKVHSHDGIGYPVELSNGQHMGREEIEVYYDFDLSDMNIEIPDKFWWDEGNRRKYPNVHTYIREQRFGETVSEAIYKVQNGMPLPSGWDKYLKG